MAYFSYSNSVWEESLKRLKEKDVSHTLNDFIV